MPLTDETRKLIFNKLKHHLEKCCPPMVVSAETKDTSFELSGNKEVPYGHDKKPVPGMYFASIAQRSDSVVFYFFPCYMHTGFKEIAPSLYTCLKGKTCFHFKKTEQVNEAELDAMLQKGIEVWVKEGYMK
jgi:hypothetical protein